MLKILYFTKYTEAGPSSRYRSYQYQNYFAENGFDVTFYPLFPTQYIQDLYGKGKKNWLILIPKYIQRFFKIITIKNYDIIYIEYELFPFVPFFFEKIALLGKKNIVLDYDDATFHSYDKNKNKIVQFICAKKIYQLVAKASLVITGSPYLTDVLSKYNTNVIEIPTSINFKKYQQESNSSEIKNTNFKIGWVGSKYTSVNILPLKNVFIELQNKYDIELCLLGFDKKLLPQLNGVNYSFLEWNQASEVNTIQSFDVGIMPLDDNFFNKGKCGFKLIQYMACGIPTISTPLPANVKINRDNCNQFATTQQDWFDAFVNSIQQSESSKKNIGENNKLIVKNYYCVEANYLKYLTCFNQLLQNHS